MLFAYKNMIASFHMLICFVNDYFKPEWKRKVCDITREVVECLLEEKIMAQLFNEQNLHFILSH